MDTQSKGYDGDLGMDIWLVIGYIVIVILIVIIVIGFSAVWPSLVGAPWVPISKATARKMLELAEVTSEDTVADLGSGDGRIILLAAEEFWAHCLGIEVDPLRVLWSRGIIRRRGLRDSVKVIWGNFYNQSLADATVITIFQGQAINNRLKAKFEAELSPGTRVVSYSFPFNGWTPVETVDTPRLFLYIIWLFFEG